RKSAKTRRLHSRHPSWKKYGNVSDTCHVSSHVCRVDIFGRCFRFADYIRYVGGFAKCCANRRDKSLDCRRCGAADDETAGRSVGETSLSSVYQLNICQCERRTKMK